MNDAKPLPWLRFIADSDVVVVVVVDVVVGWVAQLAKLRVIRVRIRV